MLKAIVACIMLATVTPCHGAEEGLDSLVSATDSITKEIYKADSMAAKLTVAKDSAAVKKMKRDWATWSPDPKRALWLAIVLPGVKSAWQNRRWHNCR